ncbi:MAG: stage 0 sporulation family protein [Hyphomicrobiales bacterium]
MEKEDKKQDINNTDKFKSRGLDNIPDPSDTSIKSCSYQCSKLDSYDWLSNVVSIGDYKYSNVAEVRFKNNRKEFFSYSKEMQLKEGDLVAVEATPGHDIGIVCLIGDAVRLQIEKKKSQIKRPEFKKIYRRVRPSDIEKWIVAVDKEDETFIKSKQTVEEVGLEMKINDVEYQGDNTKAIFYYTADDRVDFRELIKKLAEIFRVRIEMRQIGVRQEAGKLGGIGSCGRELCCSTWMTNFRSVTTNTARLQQLSLNPQKLAGQCGKLKCCLNFEYDGYKEALQEFPDQETVLKTKKGNAIHQKTDVYQKIIWYSYENDPFKMIPIPLDKAYKIISVNKRGKLVDKLEDYSVPKEQGEIIVDLKSDVDINEEPSKPKKQNKSNQNGNGGNRRKKNFNRKPRK